MKAYPLSQIQAQQQEVFAQAVDEPVLITQEQQPSHVILSVAAYQDLIARLEELEDFSLGKAADLALQHSSMVGTQEFTDALESLANG